LIGYGLGNHVGGSAAAGPFFIPRWEEALLSDFSLRLLQLSDSRRRIEALLDSLRGKFVWGSVGLTKVNASLTLMPL
jgi:hypothetical protein